MTRYDIINLLVRRHRLRRYVEIGVADGSCFFQIRALRKWAVDPKFAFRSGPRRRYLRHSPVHLLTDRYFEMTSDRFFETHGDDIERFGPQLFFIDGLHTYEQSRRDVVNALRYLPRNGFIVLHDCLPPNHAASVPAECRDHAEAMGLPGWTGAWCGDVYKTVLWLRSQRLDTVVDTVDTDFGVGILRWGTNAHPLRLSSDAIEDVGYDELIANQASYLGLVGAAQFAERAAD